MYTKASNAIPRHLKKMAGATGLARSSDRAPHRMMGRTRFNRLVQIADLLAQEVAAFGRFQIALPSAGIAFQSVPLVVNQSERATLGCGFHFAPGMFFQTTLKIRGEAHVKLPV